MRGLPIRQKAQLSQSTSVIETLPAPIGGKNSRDSKSALLETEAIELINMMPGQRGLVSRRGCDEVTTGYSAIPETAIPYVNGATKLLVTASGTTLYTDDGAGTLSSIATSLSNARWQGVQLGANMMLANGADAPRNFDGSSITTISFSGDISTYGEEKIHGFHKHKNRVYAWDVDHPNFFYGGVNAVAGAFSEFNLENVSDTGGNILEIKTISRDAGDGPDDYIAFILDTGEILIYAGSDPGTASSWALTGKFKAPPIIGIRCAREFAGDILLLTQSDLLKLTDVIKYGTEEGGLNITPSKLAGDISADFATYGTNYGWSLNIYPAGGWIIVNVPEVSGSRYHQHVVNTTTGAYTTFNGWNSSVYGVLNQKLYFGTGTSLYQGDVGTSDNGDAIFIKAQQAFSVLRTGRKKKVNNARLYMESEGALNIDFSIGYDFDFLNPQGSTLSEVDGAEWDTADWDTAEWAGDSARLITFTVAGIGTYVSPQVSLSITGQRVTWYSTTFNFNVSQTY